MKIVLKIQRFDPETDRAPHFEDYPVQAKPTDRVLDALLFVKNFIDGSLALRKSCAHGVCGSDAMLINGKEHLACKTLVQDVAGEEGAVVRIEPLRHLPLQRDLMVDQNAFFDSYRAVKPYFINSSPVESGERIQTPEERNVFDDSTSCILCASCYSACPVLDQNERFLGPAAILQAARFIFDSRDQGFEDRLAALDQENGVWACENHFECTRVCPRSIKVTKNINLTKRKIKERTS